MRKVVGGEMTGEEKRDEPEGQMNRKIINSERIKARCGRKRSKRRREYIELLSQSYITQKSAGWRSLVFFIIISRYISVHSNWKQGSKTTKWDLLLTNVSTLCSMSLVWAEICFFVNILTSECFLISWTESVEKRIRNDRMVSVCLYVYLLKLEIWKN